MAFLTTHKYRREITLDSSLVDSNLTDFPVMIRLSNSVNIDMSKTKTDGSDVLFTASDGETILKFEREKHDKSGGEGIYWVKIPILSSSSNTIIYVYYDDTTALADQEDPSNTWTTDIKAVYHLKESGNGTSGEFEDSTSNNHDGQGGGGTGSRVPTQVDDIIGFSQSFDGGDGIEVPHSTDFNLTSALRIRAWVNSSDYNQSYVRIVDKYNGSTDSVFACGINSNSIYFGIWKSSAQTFFDNAGTLTNGNDHLIVWEWDGSTMRAYIDGVDTGTTASLTPSSDTSSAILSIGQLGNHTRFFTGKIDEVRIGDTAQGADWAKAEYNSEADNLATFGNEEAIITIDESILINDTTQSLETIARINESILINDTDDQQSPTKNITESILINDSTTSNTDAKFPSKIISYNPLILVTDTDPAEIVSINISDPENPTHTVFVLTGAKNASDVVRNTTTGYLYISCADGIVVKVNENDFEDQTIIDLSDTDDLTEIETIESLGLTYVSTNNSVGELYLIDERETIIGDMRLDVLAELSSSIDSDFNAIEGKTMDSDITVLAEQTNLITADFKCTSEDVIGRKDFDIKIDGTSLNQFDFSLESIEITKTIDENQTAIFTLCRRHDELNKDLEGNTVQITNQNDVQILVDGEVWFEGEIENLNPIYNNDQEQVTVTARGLEEECRFNTVTMSLPSIDKPLNIYDILSEEHNIFTPFIDPDDNNNTNFKGVRIPLGTKITQSLSRLTKVDSLGADAERIQDGSFIFRHANTYFWSPTVTRFGTGDVNVTGADETTPFNTNIAFTPGQVRTQKFNYIGTSLSPISNDLWVLDQADHRRQRIYEDITLKLGNGTVSASDFSEVVDNTSLLIAELQNQNWIDGSGNITTKFKKSTSDDSLNINFTQEEQAQIYEILELNLGYTVGEAPFKDISSRNGIFIPKFRWEDKPDGLYSVKDTGYNFEDFVKKIADLEYEKMKNINGDIFPQTTCNLDISLDAYKYYNIKLLTRIKIDNTTEKDIFTTNNGFPTAVKSITINAGTMRVSLATDNIKSNKELEAIDGEFPDENSEEYNTDPEEIKIFAKTDMKTRLEVS